MQSLEIRYSDVKQQTTVLAIHSLVVHAGMRFLVNAEKFITPASSSCFFFFFAAMIATFLTRVKH